MRAFVLAALLVVACGPGSRHDGTGGDDDGSGSGSDCPTCSTVTGKIYAPKWAPGDVPPGQEIPIFGATIYVSDTRPQPLPQQVYCEPCVETPQGAVQSRHDGSFELSVAGPGHYFLVIQKGAFRLEQEIDIPQGVTALPPSATTLPDRLDPTNGAWIPKIAIARGNFDAVEDILGKIGFGTMGGNKLASPDNEITFYEWDGSGNSSVEYLISNIDELRKYHIIFFPCSTLVQSEDYAPYTENWLTEPNLKNLRQWVAEGGKLYVTDWSGEVADRTFPPQITLGSGGFGSTDSVGTYDPTTLDGTLTTPGDADGSLYTADDGKAVDPDLNMWLGLQTGPTEDDPTPHLYDADHFAVTDNWNYITALNSVMKGVDENNSPVYDDPKAWITGSDGEHGDGPLAVTYEPAGCGKVLYSTFQTSGASASEEHMGLMPQERVLLFLIMEISSCTQNPIIL
jgi:hypothetical protein